MMQSETHIGWQDYLAIVFRRRLFFTVPCAAVVVITLIVGLFLPKIYRSETVLLIEDQKVINPLMQGLAISTPVADRLRTLREELLSWTSLSRLAHELGMDRQAQQPILFEKMIKRLQQKIGVGMRGRDLVSIAYEDRDPEMTQRLVNTITNIYMERNAESQTAEAQTAIGFIEDEMAVYKRKLEESELALREFKELYVMQMPVANQLNDQVVELEVLLAQMLVENTEEHPTVLQTRHRIAELKRTRNDELKRVIATALAKGHDPAFYEDLLNTLSDATTAGVTPKDPAMQRAMEAYQALVTRMDSPTTQATVPGTPPIQVVTTPGGAADAAFEVLGAESASLSLSPREEQELTRLTRDYRVHSKTYQAMQERLERAKTTERLEASDEGTKFKVLEPARLPLRPVRPNFVKMFFFSLMLGMAVGAGIAFIAEYLDQSFQSAEEVQGALELPVIGSISTIVTEDDLEARRRHRRGWVTFKNQLQLVRTYVIQPIWSRFDRALVRWGL